MPYWTRPQTNFRRAAGSPANVGAGRPMGCLALAETARDHVFAAISAEDARWRPRRWTVRPTGDAAAIILRSPDNEELVMLAGSQIATAERLEVLALATTQRYPDGRPLRETLSRTCCGRSFGSDSLGLRQVVVRARALVMEDLGVGAELGRFCSVTAVVGRSPRRARNCSARPSGVASPFFPARTLFLIRHSRARRVASVSCSTRGAPMIGRRRSFARSSARLRRSPPCFGSRVNCFEFAWLQLAMNARTRLQRIA